jgi:hypothetical protein
MVMMISFLENETCEWSDGYSRLLLVCRLRLPDDLRVTDRLFLYNGGAVEKFRFILRAPGIGGI